MSRNTRFRTRSGTDCSASPISGKDRSGAPRAPASIVASPDAAVVNRVEEKLERSVRLSSERDIGTEQQYPSAANRRVNHGGCPVQTVLTAGPSASQRRPAGKPRNP